MTIKLNDIIDKGGDPLEYVRKQTKATERALKAWKEKKTLHANFTYKHKNGSIDPVAVSFGTQKEFHSFINDMKSFFGEDTSVDMANEILLNLVEEPDWERYQEESEADAYDDYEEALYDPH